MMKSTREDKGMEAAKKAREVSEIAEDDNREVRDSVIGEVIESCERASEEFKSGKRKLMSLEELDKLLKDSKLTEEGCLRLGDEVKQGTWEKLKKEERA